MTKVLQRDTWLWFLGSELAGPEQEDTDPAIRDKPSRLSPISHPVILPQGMDRAL